MGTLISELKGSLEEFPDLLTFEQGNVAMVIDGFDYIF